MEATTSPWFNAVKSTKFFAFIYFIVTEKKKIILEEKYIVKTNILMRKINIIIDLPKIRVGRASTTKN